MKLMFLATRTRPDTLTTVCALSKKCRDPNEADMKRLYRVIGYLDNTINLGLTCHVTDLSLHAYLGNVTRHHDHHRTLWLSDLVQVHEAEGCHEIQYRSRACVLVLWNGHSIVCKTH